jgi:long-chain acyl-CoA synthetase
LAAILYTGGTTQAPKGAPYTHDLLLDPVSAQLETFQGVIPPGHNTIMLAAPLFHITGITFGIGAMCLYGDSVILIPRLNLDALMAAVDRRRATSLFGGPSLYRLLLEHDRLGHYSLRSLKYCFSGGDVFPGQVGRRWLDRYGLRIVQGYGATETGGGVILCPPDRSFPDQSVGWPVPGKRLKLVDPDTLDDVPDGRPGELLVGSDPMIEAYWNRPEESNRAFISVDGRLWYRTGDMLRRDDDGYYYFVDRVDDAVWTRNGRVSVSEIETRLQEHPAVTAACVVGAPGADGDRLKAFVVLKENQRGLAGRDLTLWLGQRLPPHKIPEYIEFRDSLPRSKVGKLLRREIRSEQQGRLIKGRYDAAAED